MRAPFSQAESVQLHRSGSDLSRSCVCSATASSPIKLAMTQLAGTIPVPGGNVWFKRVGGGAGLPLLAVHGGPGLPHTYMRSLERLADEREVVFWDQLGCGNSERPSNVQLWTMERSVAEMDAVIRSTGPQPLSHLWQLVGRDVGAAVCA